MCEPDRHIRVCLVELSGSHCIGDVTILPVIGEIDTTTSRLPNRAYGIPVTEPWPKGSARPVG
jgi:hypothetical protein